VADLDRAVAFYRDVLGFELRVKFADTAAFLVADGTL
jgi:catechol 2,3-dioxygenase